MKTARLTIPLLLALAYGPAQGWAVPLLGADLTTFAVLGATTVTNVVPSTIVGNVGVWASGAANAVTGFPGAVAGAASADSQVTSGLVHSGTDTGTPNAASAQGDLTTARTNLGRLGIGTLLPVDLAGLTIFPGVFTVAAGTTNLSGTVTLDGLGNPNAFWLFQTNALTTASGAVVSVINTGASGGAGVFWNDTSSVTLNSTTSFQGNILALTSIFLRTGATIGCGRALADTGEVTLQMNTINAVDCAAAGWSGSGLEFDEVSGGIYDSTADRFVSVAGTFQPTDEGAVVPEPGTLLLFGFGLAGLIACRKQGHPVA